MSERPHPGKPAGPARRRVRRGLLRLGAGAAAALGGGGLLLLLLTAVNPVPPAPQSLPPPSPQVQWQGTMPSTTYRMLAPFLPGTGGEPLGMRSSLQSLREVSLAQEIGEAPPRLLLEEHGAWDQWFLLRQEEATERPLILENTEETLRLFGREPMDPAPTFPARVLVEWTELTTGQTGRAALPASEELLAARRESSNLSPAVFLLQRNSGGLVPEPLRTASSGSSAVDRRLGELLRTADLALPADTHYLRLTLHLPPVAPDA